MALIADIFLAAGAFGAAIYCIVLSRRLSRFTDLEKGVGGAVAVLSAQVDDMTRALERARKTASGSAAGLTELTGRAEGVAQRLELLVASMHDLPAVAEPAGKSASEAETAPPAGPAPSTRPPAAEPAEAKVFLEMPFAGAASKGRAPVEDRSAEPASNVFTSARHARKEAV